MSRSFARNSCIAAIGSVFLLGAAPVMAEATYPTRPVRIIVPNAPGGITDINARFVAEALTQKWGQQVLVENRPGAGSDIGLRAAAASPADGYTLFSTTNSQTAIDPVLYPEKSQQNDAFVPVIQIAENRIAIVAGPSFAGKSFADVIAAAKSNPGKVTYASAGIASVPHLAAEWLAAEAGIKLRHIPFKGGSGAVAAAASGEVLLASVAASSILSFVKSGHVRPLAVTSPTQSAVAAGWPNSAELGYPRVDISVWSGLFARTGTPPSILAKIEADVKEILADPEFRQRLLAAGSEVSDAAGDVFVKKIAVESDAIRKVVTDAKIATK